MDDSTIGSMMESIDSASGKNRKTPVFMALMLIHSDDMNFEEGQDGADEAKIFLSKIGMPESYLPQLRSLMKVRGELRNLGFEINLKTGE